MKGLFIFLCILCALSGNAQEKLGISNSNYSSTNSIFLNPSSSVDSRTYMQFNLVGANAYAMNNVGYIPNFSLWRLQRTRRIDDAVISNLKLNKFLYGYGTIEGPAFVMSKRNYGFGFFTRARTIVDIKGMPFNLTTLLLGQNPMQEGPEDVNLKNVKFSNMSWAEYGANFGLIVRRDRNILVTAGANLKYLTGMDIVYGNLTTLKGNSNDSAINVDEIKGKLRFNETAWNSGRGLGLDIGVTYKKMLATVEGYYPHSTRSGCNFIDYKYKIAFSLRDLGYIRFDKKTTRGDMDASGYIYTNRNESYYRTSIGADLNTTISNDPIWATTPTNFSGQFDWNFENHIYLNTTLVKNLVPNRFTGVQSPDLISFCPRFEFRQFEVAMPLTLHKFIYPQLGFAFRIRSFVLGFDNVFPLLFTKKTYGLNVYFSLGFSIFKNPACKVKKLNVAECAPGKKGTGNKKGLRGIFKKGKKKNNVL